MHSNVSCALSVVMTINITVNYCIPFTVMCQLIKGNVGKGGRQRKREIGKERTKVFTEEVGCVLMGGEVS